MAFTFIIANSQRANVAKLVDALDLGSSGNPVRVRVSPFAPALLKGYALLLSAIFWHSYKFLRLKILVEVKKCKFLSSRHPN